MSSAILQRNSLNARNEIARGLPRLTNHLAGMLDFIGIRTFAELMATSDAELTSRGEPGRRLDGEDVAIIRQHLANKFPAGVVGDLNSQPGEP